MSFLVRNQMPNHPIVCYRLYVIYLRLYKRNNMLCNNIHIYISKTISVCVTKVCGARSAVLLYAQNRDSENFRTSEIAAKIALYMFSRIEKIIYIRLKYIYIYIVSNNFESTGFSVGFATFVAFLRNNVDLPYQCLGLI